MIPADEWQLSPLALRGLGLLDREWTRGATPADPAEWQAWADDLLLACDGPPPEWLCVLSLRRPEPAGMDWARRADSNDALRLLFGVWYLLHRAGRRRTFEDLLGAAHAELIDAESGGSPVGAWADPFRPLIRRYIECVGPPPELGWAAGVVAFFRPCAAAVARRFDALPPAARITARG